MLAATEPGLVDRLLLLSYPLHPPRRPGELRTAHFPQLQVPALSSMNAGWLRLHSDEMVAALKLIPVRTELLPVTGAGHELLTKRNRMSWQRWLWRRSGFRPAPCRLS